MKTRSWDQKLDLDTPEGSRFLKSIESCMEVKIGFTVGEGLHLGMSFNKDIIEDAFARFLEDSIVSKKFEFDSELRKGISIGALLNSGPSQKDTSLRLAVKEILIMDLLSEGDPEEEIAEVLKMKLHTLEAHIDKIIRKLKAKNKIHAVIIYLKSCGRLIDSPPDSLLNLDDLGSVKGLN